MIDLSELQRRFPHQKIKSQPAEGCGCGGTGKSRWPSGQDGAGRNERRHTMSNTPSDEDIVALAISEGIKLRTGAGVVRLARAVLAK